MANRYYTEFSDRKVSAPMPPKEPDGVKVGYPPEKTSGFPKPDGSAGPSRNAVGFYECHHYVDQKLADDKSKMKKVMHEYKEGELHSGSKKGPVVKDRKQAVAIAMSEAGMGRKRKKY